MKHVKEWYICDRCGAELTGTHGGRLFKKIYTISGFFVKDGKLDGVVKSDLCPKCSKDFERFMKNA